MSMTNILFVTLLLMCSAFFSAAETAYTSVNALRLRRAADSGERLAQVAYHVYERFEAAISAILIGNNLVNMAASSLGTVVFVALMGDAGAGVASVVMTVLVLVLGEITPKIIAKQLCDQIVRLAAWPLRVLMLALTPIAKCVLLLVDKISDALLPERQDAPSITEEEFSAILDMVEDEGVIDEDRTDLLQSALMFDETTVQQVMTPRVDMVALDIDDPLDALLEETLDSGYSRIPIYEDTIDNIVGILHVNRFLGEMAENGRADVRDSLMEPLKLHKTLTLDAALRLMRRRRIHMAIVIDEYGGTLGAFTMEDLLEQLVGDIWDEGDDIEEECVEVGENQYLCSGTMDIQEFFDLIDYDPQDFECEYLTLGGWAVEMLDAQPEQGKSFQYDHLTVTVHKMDGVRVEQLLIQVEPEREDEE